MQTKQDQTDARIRANSGYHDCPCRDCFEIAIGCDKRGNPHLCHSCKRSGCDATGGSECDSPHAYGG